MNVLSYLLKSTVRFLDWIRALSPIARKIVVAIIELRVVVTLVQGQMLKDAGDLSMLYVGRSANLPHFRKNFFSDSKIVETKKSSLLTYRKHLKAVEANADVMFMDIGWPYDRRMIKKGDYRMLPDWISMAVPMDEDWDNVTRNFRKTMRKNIGRLIRRNEYRCEPTTDPGFIENFYDELYVPLVNSRYAGEASLTSRKLIELRARQGTVLQVMGKEGLVSAGVYFKSKGVSI